MRVAVSVVQKGWAAAPLMAILHLFEMHRMTQRPVMAQVILSCLWGLLQARPRLAAGLLCSRWTNSLQDIAGWGAHQHCQCLSEELLLLQRLRLIPEWGPHSWLAQLCTRTRLSAPGSHTTSVESAHLNTDLKSHFVAEATPNITHGEHLTPQALDVAANAINQSGAEAPNASLEGSSPTASAWSA